MSPSRQNDLDALTKILIGTICLAAIVYAAITTVGILAERGITAKEVDVSAWVQAIGSVLGIFAGAAGIWWQARAQQQFQILQAATSEFNALNVGYRHLSIATGYFRRIFDVTMGQQTADPNIDAFFAKAAARQLLLLKTFDVFVLPNAALQASYQAAVDCFDTAVSNNDSILHWQGMQSAITPALAADARLAIAQAWSQFNASMMTIEIALSKMQSSLQT